MQDEPDDEPDDEPKSQATRVVAAIDVPLDGPIYEGVHAHLSVEVREFGSGRRTMVVRMWVDGIVQTAMVDWDRFTDAFDGMRSGMMSSDWDDALSHLTGHDDPDRSA